MTGSYPARWLHPDWRAEAVAWATDRLGAPRLDAAVQTRVRPWSTLLRLTVADGEGTRAWWLKACSPGTAYEAPLLALLAGWGLPHVPRPVAVDAALALALLPDGGATVRQRHPEPSVEATAQLLQAAALIARGTSAHVPEMLAAGVPDLRPERVDASLAALLDDPALTSGPHPLPAEARDRVDRHRARLREDAALLAAGPVPAALQHDDLHDGNVLADPLVVIDWGDASVAHPFATLLVTLNAHAHRAGLGAQHPDLARLRDRYLEHWTDLAPLSELQALAAAAVRLAPVGRAWAWRRALSGADTAARQEWGDGVAGWLEELVGDDLPLQGADRARQP